MKSNETSNNEELYYNEEHLSCFLYDNYAIPMITHICEFKGENIIINDAHNKIIFLVSGEINFLYENNQINFEEGTFILLPRGCNYKMNIVEDMHLVVVNLRRNINFCEHYPVRLLCQWKKQLIINSSILHPLKINRIIHNYLEGVMLTSSQGLRCSYYLKIKQQELLYYLRAYYSKTELVHFLAPILNEDSEFAELIYQHHTSVKSLEELANITNYSISGFKKRFVRVFGTSPYKWLEKEKAKKVHYDINCTNKPFKEIALKYHFISPSHFDSFCKKFFNMSPGGLRDKTINDTFEK